MTININAKKKPGIFQPDTKRSTRNVDDFYSPFYDPDAEFQAAQQEHSYPAETPIANTQFESAMPGTSMYMPSQSQDYTDYGTVQDKDEKKPTYSIRTPSGTNRQSTSLGALTPTTTTMPIAPNTPAPTFALPEWDDSKVSEYRRKYMAPVRGVREGLRRTLASHPSSSNPYVAKEMGRGAVEALGTSISDISMKAGAQGLNEYLRKRAEEIAALQTQYQGQLAVWLKQFGQKTTKTYEEDEEGNAAFHWLPHGYRRV